MCETYEKYWTYYTKSDIEDQNKKQKMKETFNID